MGLWCGATVDWHRLFAFPIDNILSELVNYFICHFLQRKQAESIIDDFYNGLPIHCGGERSYSSHVAEQQKRKSERSTIKVDWLDKKSTRRVQQHLIWRNRIEFEERLAFNEAEKVGGLQRQFPFGGVFSLWAFKERFMKTIALLLNNKRRRGLLRFLAQYSWHCRV